MTTRLATKSFLTGALGLVLSLLATANAFSQEATKKFAGKAVPAIATQQSTNAEFPAGTGPAEVPTDRLALVFLLICGLLYLTYFGLKKYKNWSRSAVNKKRSVGVIDTIPLGGKRFVTVTRVYDRILVLGVGEDSITLLTELKEGEEGSAPALVPANPPVPASRAQLKPAEHFANLLSSLTKRKQAKTETPTSAQAETAIL